MRNTFFLATIAIALSSVSMASTVAFPGKKPGKATAALNDSTYTIGNSLLSASFNFTEGDITFDGLKAADGTLLVKGDGPIFQIKLDNGRKLTSSDMEVSAPQIKQIKASKKSLRASEQVGGQSISATFKAPDDSFHSSGVPCCEMIRTTCARNTP